MLGTQLDKLQGGGLTMAVGKPLNKVPTLFHLETTAAVVGHTKHISLIGVCAHIHTTCRHTQYIYTPNVLIRT